MISLLFAALIIGSGLSVDWAPTINTFLLIILALVTAWGNRRASKERRVMADTAAVVSEQTADIQQQIAEADRVILTPPVPGGKRATDPPHVIEEAPPVDREALSEWNRTRPSNRDPR